MYKDVYQLSSVFCSHILIASSIGNESMTLLTIYTKESFTFYINATLGGK